MNRRWHVLDRIIKENGFKRVAELGVKEGKTTEFLLANNPDLEVIAVDLWASNDGAEKAGHENYQDWDFNEIMAEFSKRTGPYCDRLITLHMSTDDAAGKVEDGSLDLVFIDALHSYEGVLNDIKHWSPKVRAGGIVSGHDFNQKWPGVQRAVSESFNVYSVQLESDSVWWVIR